MDDHKMLIDSLRAYYSEHGIGAENFCCKHEAECKGALPYCDPPKRERDCFSTAVEAWIGPDYGVGNLPRLVFLSLDSGAAFKCRRVIERRDEWHPGHWKERPGWEKEKKGWHLSHWFRTCEVARRLLREFDQRVGNISRKDMWDTERYFAHTNSARCCQNKKGNAEAHRILFDNCREFVGPELEILRPDILISQGDWAKLAVQQHFPAPLRTFHSWLGILGECKTLKIGGQECLWYHTYHPNQGGGFFRCQWKIVIEPYEGLPRIVVEFMKAREAGAGGNVGVR
jgi:hypothetical protein